MEKLVSLTGCFFLIILFYVTISVPVTVVNNSLTSSEKVVSVQTTEIPREKTTVSRIESSSNSSNLQSAVSKVTGKCQVSNIYLDACTKTEKMVFLSQLPAKLIKIMRKI